MILAAMAADENTDARAVFSSEHPDHHVCANTETWTGAAAAAAKASGSREMKAMVRMVLAIAGSQEISRNRSSRI